MSNYYGNYNRKKKGSALQTVVCILLSIILLGVIAGGIFVGVKSEGFRNWDYFKGEQTEQVVPEEGSGVTDGEGNELESGTSYEMPASMVYAVPTAQSTTAASGVTVTAFCPDPDGHAGTLLRIWEQAGAGGFVDLLSSPTPPRRRPAPSTTRRAL